MDAQDTPRDVRDRQIALLRAAGPTRRFEAARDLTRTVIGLSRAALRRNRPGAREEDLEHEWLALHYGPSIAAWVRRLRS